MGIFWRFGEKSDPSSGSGGHTVAVMFARRPFSSCMMRILWMKLLLQISVWDKDLPNSQELREKFLWTFLAAV
jgi:hypothetical protein